ncbi:MAG: dienelactone hydrolase family protein [Elainella sp. Prado103]|jgi:phospholipase/carboxylesterase|nr:dienelactone hydrolase family protein [Elainella sp. Prado103]
MLHGWGANAADVAALSGYLNLPQLQFFFPNAPHPFPYSPLGRMWYDLPPDYRFGDAPTQTQLDQLQQSRDRLVDYLKSLEATTGVPLDRTILAGFSQGGAMTLDVGLDLPLAALMVLSGYAHRPMVVSPDRSPPVLLVHGQIDQVVPLQAAHQAREQLLAQGTSVQYHELNMGHEIQPIVLKLMQSFIEETVFPPES